MGLYEDLERSLLEAIEIENGTIPVVPRENMPAPTYTAEQKERELIDHLIALRKEQNISQKQLAELTGSRQQAVSRLEQKSHCPSLRLFCSMADALGYELQFVKKKL